MIIFAATERYQESWWQVALKESQVNGIVGLTCHWHFVMLALDYAITPNVCPPAKVFFFGAILISTNWSVNCSLVKGILFILSSY